MIKKLVWNSSLAYAIGLIATDGCLYKDGRHIDLTSKDIDQVKNFSSIFSYKGKISQKKSTYNPEGIYYRVQFSNVKLYRFLQRVGLHPHKSLELDALKIPPNFFADFLRGHLDGDGNISIVRHPESQYLQLRLRFASASFNHIKWLKTSIGIYYNILGGYIYKIRTKNIFQLTFAKADSKKLLELMYYDGVQYCLRRKLEIVNSIRGEWRNRYTRTV